MKKQTFAKRRKRRVMRIPDEYQAFLEEYVDLCDKHGIFIFSEGEELQVGKSVEEDNGWDCLWGIRDLLLSGECRKHTNNSIRST